MDIKNIYQFKRFDWDAFAKDKLFRCIGIAQWSEYKTKEVLGTKVQVAIVKDDTPYKPFKDGSPAPNNLFEKIDFKIPKSKKDVQVKVGDMVIPVNAVATVYTLKDSTKENQLSIKADDVKVLQPKKGA